MFWWYAVCKCMQYPCDWSTTACTPLPWPPGRPSSSLSLQLQPRAGGFLGDDGDKTFEMSLDTCESENHKAKCVNWWGDVALSVPFTIRIHPQWHLQVHPCNDTMQQNMTIWIWTDLFQNYDHKKPAGQPKQTEQTYQATQAPWRPPNSLAGVLRVWLPPTEQGW